MKNMKLSKRFQRSPHRQGIAYKLKSQAMDDPVQVQLKKMAEGD